MIDPKTFFDALKNNSIESFSGVPDSLLKNICAFITDNVPKKNHLITANEGSAIALATGQYLSTGKLSLVYMQNSGFGNAINPLLSLSDPMVYGVPMLLLVGWRGEPGVKDEPQHVKQGLIMEDLLKSCNIPYEIIDSKLTDVDSFVQSCVNKAKAISGPVVILVKKDTFKSYSPTSMNKDIGICSREDALEEIVKSTNANDIFISTTGMASRELYEIRERNNDSTSHDFLTVGSMGHASMIALGVAQNNKNSIICVDGDGAALMHLGNMTSVGLSDQKKLIHILLNNAAHDSVGGQPTCGNELNFRNLALNFGYSNAISISDVADLGKIINKFKQIDGPNFIEIKVNKGARKNLGRPKTSPEENKIKFMEIKNL